jgi:hypothetical protein
MMLAKYVDRNGLASKFDLDSVVDVVEGLSQIRSGWEGLIVYLPGHKIFIELMSTVPDIRGNSNSKAKEVDASYVKTIYGLTDEQLYCLEKAPSQWEFIRQR